MNSKEFEKDSQELFVIDLAHIFATLWKRAWVIILAGCLLAGAAFAYATYGITPMYSASTMLYVNNSVALGGTGISVDLGDINTSRSLVKTYIVILQNRTTLEEVIENTGVPYTYGQLSGMISASQVDGTEVFRVTVTASDPYVAADIANAITDVLPRRVEEIIEGASMKCVDRAVVNLNKVSPSISKYTVLGFAIGVVLACALLALFAMLDDTVHDEEYLLREYDYPLLAQIPDLLETGGRAYYYDKKDQMQGGGGNA